MVLIILNYVSLLRLGVGLSVSGTRRRTEAWTMFIVPVSLEAVKAHTQARSLHS